MNQPESPPTHFAIPTSLLRRAVKLIGKMKIEKGVDIWQELQDPQVCRPISIPDAPAPAKEDPKKKA